MTTEAPPPIAPLVTIVTPSLNQGRHIRETIESVLGQDHPRLEYIVVDGGSTDDTAAIVAEYAGRVTWICEPDRGQSDAINKGLARARDGIVGWLNADDLLLPGCVQAVAGCFGRHPELGAVFGTGHTIDGEGRFVRRWEFLHSGDPYVHLHADFLQPAFFFRRSALERIGPVDVTLHWRMDWDLFLRLQRHFPIAHLERDLAAYREYPENKTQSGGRAMFRESVRVMRRHLPQRFPPDYVRTLLTVAASEAPSFAAPAVRRLQAIVAPRFFGYGADGWVAKRFWFSVLPAPSEGAVLEIRGLVPEWVTSSKPQVLRVRSGGRTLARAEVGPGEFVIAVPLDVPSPTAVQVQLLATTAAVPRRVGVNTHDRRPIAYQLRSIRWVESQPSGARKKTPSNCSS